MFLKHPDAPCDSILAGADTLARTGEGSDARNIVLWFTGMSGSGKSTLGVCLQWHFREHGLDALYLDGDVFRGHTGNRDFSPEGRERNIAQVREHVIEKADSHPVTLCSFITPYRSMRVLNRERIPNYFEVYCKCDLETLIARDVKGLYRKALAGGIGNFTGISDSYEEPDQPDIVVDTSAEALPESVAKILTCVRKTFPFLMA